MMPVPLHPRRSFWQRAKALNDRIENCWVGDLIGLVWFVVLLFASLFLTEVFR